MHGMQAEHQNLDDRRERRQQSFGTRKSTAFLSSGDSSSPITHRVQVLTEGTDWVSRGLRMQACVRAWCLVGPAPPAANAKMHQLSGVASAVLAGEQT
ncbi:hypothetical protein CB0940_06463 [Cercospora beticola]|uniref:Uncharacterized protein n=1 Tax=Cercospora beticola TaxID=122368 RepID=A0A2G5HXW4_CERBT|nr:hypothetical protein CB0940_06463 [Cercospora beticola]PIA97082.1 hypothetical protein CB0940_06463 [Cercospora beticola]WPA99101.1 hypothetical protein RHO25_003716 [Cercospora beticola]